MRFGILAEVILPVIFVFFLATTMYGMMVSDTGYGALPKLIEKRDAGLIEVNELRTRRIWMEHRASLMASEQLDPDMVDERIRDVLGYAATGDLVIKRDGLREAIAMINNSNTENGTQAPILDTNVVDALAQADLPTPISTQSIPIVGSPDPIAGIIVSALQ